MIYIDLTPDTADALLSHEPPAGAVLLEIVKDDCVCCGKRKENPFEVLCNPCEGAYLLELALGV